MDLARRRQIGLGLETQSSIYVVESGCLTLDVVLPDDRRQILLILYPGEMISREMVPGFQHACLTAMVPSVVSRVTIADAAGGAMHDEELSSAYASSIGRLMARSSLHALMIGRLTGEERLVSLLIEMALLSGSQTAGGYTFELPLTRDDMADYLALNPDTLSRMISKLKSRHLISLPTRHRAIIKDFDAMAAATPLADALRRLSKPTASKPWSASRAPAA